jgi:hypothetical protein
MKAKEVIKEIKNNGVSIASSEEKQLIKIQGTLTSSLQLRGENVQEPYYYAFIKLKGQKVDLPTIFKIKDDQGKLTKPNLKKSDEVELMGNYSNSQQNVRKSFTCYSYQLLNEKRIRKKCVGCCDTFICSQSKNYDYCKNCEINGSRYVSRENKCLECGDGSGTIKFPNQSPRSCKTCYLANRVILEQAKEQLPYLEAEAEKISQARQQLEK